MSKQFKVGFLDSAAMKIQTVLNGGRWEFIIGGLSCSLLRLSVLLVVF